MSGGLVVTGGADGIEAKAADLHTAGHLLLTSAFGIETVVDACSWPLLLADPGWFGAGFGVHLRIRAVLGATRALADDLRHLGTLLDAAAATYESGDRGIWQRLGDAMGALFRTGWHLATLGTEFEIRLVESRGDLAKALDALVTNDPGLADSLLPLVSMSPVLLGAMGGLQRVPDGHPVLRATGRDDEGEAAHPPRDLTDLVRELDRRDHGPHGAVDVRLLTGADGRQRAIVDITGTKAFFDVVGPDVTDLTTNARALIGRDTAYEEGVFAAMRAAGVGPQDEVMLVGHSQGGMVAVNAARDAATHGFTVTHVVTAGSPIGITVGAVPKDIQVLALENRRDAVPHLDGRDNPDAMNVTTVGFDTGPGSVSSEHGVGSSYVPGAQRVDASDDPAIRAFLAGSAGFLTATDVQTRTYVVTRAY